jgi:hypothetical protein
MYLGRFEKVWEDLGRCITEKKICTARSEIGVLSYVKLF